MSRWAHPHPRLSVTAFSRATIPLGVAARPSPSLLESPWYYGHHPLPKLLLFPNGLWATARARVGGYVHSTRPDGCWHCRSRMALSATAWAPRPGARRMAGSSGRSAISYRRRRRRRRHTHWVSRLVHVWCPAAAAAATPRLSPPPLHGCICAVTTGQWPGHCVAVASHCVAVAMACGHTAARHNKDGHRRLHAWASPRVTTRTGTAAYMPGPRHDCGHPPTTGRRQHAPQAGA